MATFLHRVYFRVMATKLSEIVKGHEVSKLSQKRSALRGAIVVKYLSPLESDLTFSEGREAERRPFTELGRKFHTSDL